MLPGIGSLLLQCHRSWLVWTPQHLVPKEVDLLFGFPEVSAWAFDGFP